MLALLSLYYAYTYAILPLSFSPLMRLLTTYFYSNSAFLITFEIVCLRISYYLAFLAWKTRILHSGLTLEVLLRTIFIPNYCRSSTRPLPHSNSGIFSSVKIQYIPHRSNVLLNTKVPLISKIFYFSKYKGTYETTFEVSAL